MLSVSIVHDNNDHMLCNFRDTSKFTTDNMPKCIFEKRECARDILILRNDSLKTLTEIVRTISYKNFMTEVKHKLAKNACIQ